MPRTLCHTLELRQHTLDELRKAESEYREAEDLHDRAKVATYAALHMRMLVGRIRDHVATGLLDACYHGGGNPDSSPDESPRS